MKILLIENRERDYNWIIETLQDEGHTVCHIRKKEMFEEKLREMEPDIIIMDIMLPSDHEQEGIELFEEMKGKSLLSSDNVLFITYRTDEYIKKMIENSKCRSLEKPFFEQALISTLEEMSKR